MKSYSCKLYLHFFIAAIFIGLIWRGDAIASRLKQHNYHNKRSVGSYDKRSVGSYDKRSANSLPGTVTFQTLKNASSTMCSDAMALPYARMVQLNDEHMRAFLQDKGGNYVKDYMAATQEEALENFQNMLVLTRPVTVDGSTSSFTMHDNLVAKQTIVDDLNKLTEYLKNNNSTNNTDTELTTAGTLGSEYLPKQTLSTESTSTRASVHINESKNNTGVLTPTSITTTVTTISHGVTNNTNITADNANVSNTLPSRPTTKAFTTIHRGQNSVPFNTNTQKSEPGTLTRTTQSTLSTRTPEKTLTTAETKTSTLDPAIVSGLEQLKQYVQGGTKRDIDTIWSNANTTLPPSTLLGLAAGNARPKRNADGSYSEENYCQKKGALTEDRKFVHLCTTCAATTRLPDNIFPRYINEAVCKTGDTDCFTIAGTSHGQCKQTKFSLNMLQKKTGHCNMLLHGGETLVFENWELVPQIIRVSCECTINKLSVFSQYAAHDAPLG